MKRGETVPDPIITDFVMIRLHTPDLIVAACQGEVPLSFRNIILAPIMNL